MLPQGVWVKHDGAGEAALVAWTSIDIRFGYIDIIESILHKCNNFTGKTNIYMVNL